MAAEQSRMETAIIIPAKDESKTIVNVIKRAKSYGSIIVIDDGSKDDTFTKASHECVVVLKHIVNLGKGAALKTGCDYAVKHGAKRIVVIDADGQHNPTQIPVFLKKLENSSIVFGYRKLSGEMPLVFRFGNWFINKVAALLFKVSLKDTQCGYRAFTADTYNKIRWRASDYFVESEMIAGVGRHKLKYSEEPIPTVYLDDYKGTTVMDGIRIVINMFFWRLRG